MDVHHYEVSGPRWEEFLMEDADFMGMMELLAHDNNDDDTRMEQSLCKEHKVCSKRASPPVFPLLTMPSNSQQTVVYEYDKTWKMKRRPTGLKYRKRKKVSMKVFVRSIIIEEWIIPFSVSHKKELTSYKDQGKRLESQQESERRIDCSSDPRQLVALLLVLCRMTAHELFCCRLQPSN